MQLKCYSCHTPFTIGRAFVDQSLNIMHEDQLVHYDIRCPKCKKTNRVSKEQMLHASPGWSYEPAAKVDEGVKETKKEKAPAKKKGSTGKKTKKKDE